MKPPSTAQLRTLEPLIDEAAQRPENPHWSLDAREGQLRDVRTYLREGRWDSALSLARSVAAREREHKIGDVAERFLARTRELYAAAQDEQQTGDAMAKNTETKQSTAHTVSAAVLEHIKKLRALHWTWGDIAKGFGYSDSGLHNLIRGARAMSTETEAKILALPLEERAPHKTRKEKKPAPTKKPARTPKPAPAPAPEPRTAAVNVGVELRTPSPVLARLDAEIEEAKQAADHIYQRLSVLRELRTKWAQEGA